MVDQQSQSFDINHVANQARQVLTNPTHFYRHMPIAGGYSEPVIFVAVMTLAMAIIGAILTLFGAGQIGAVQINVTSIILMPIMAVLGSFIGAAILFFIWKLMGSDRSYETSYRCLAYATAIYPVVAVIGIIPYLASIIGVAWFAYLMIEASVLVHNRERKTATLTFAIIGLLLILSNVSSERVARNMGKDVDRYSRHLEEWQHLPPEEMGRRMGEFLRGMEEGLQQERP